MNNTYIYIHIHMLNAVRLDAAALSQNPPVTSPPPSQAMPQLSEPRSTGAHGGPRGPGRTGRRGPRAAQGPRGAGPEARGPGQGPRGRGAQEPRGLRQGPKGPGAQEPLGPWRGGPGAQGRGGEGRGGRKPKQVVGETLAAYEILGFCVQPI